jgi:hypothetical protein
MLAWVILVYINRSFSYPCMGDTHLHSPNPDACVDDTCLHFLVQCFLCALPRNMWCAHALLFNCVCSYSSHFLEPHKHTYTCTHVHTYTLSHSHTHTHTRVWEVLTGGERASLAGHMGAVHNVSISADRETTSPADSTKQYGEAIVGDMVCATQLCPC